MWDNPWFVGIATGLVVYFLTNYLSKFFSKKEYVKKVREANREIIVLLIMSVSEERIPSLPVIKSLLKSLARSYGVKEGDLNNIRETLEDLIKEIFETKFISNEKKNEISESLIKLIDEHEKMGEVVESSNRIMSLNYTYNYILTLAVLIMSVFSALLIIVDPATNINGDESFIDRFVLPFSIGTTIAVALNIASSLRKTIKGKKNEKISINSRNEEAIK
ncbi:hypothetical protein AUC31_17645 [Planococcus rifietoensis]|uniref:Uncharacterized protein n=1 Tax=Planococcus rifietoensis TaxID=200991 RepID=A0A0X9XZX7_9BACL|nr:hypothetical protein [Planococcus rifietoensis]AMA67436.1 hypothetical protein AUC31_17645 [Planococcus rifietoensis]